MLKLMVFIGSALISFIIGYFICFETKDEVMGKIQVVKAFILLFSVLSFIFLFLDLENYLFLVMLLLTYGLGTFYWLIKNENKSKSKTKFKRRKH